MRVLGDFEKVLLLLVAEVDLENLCQNEVTSHELRFLVLWPGWVSDALPDKQLFEPQLDIAPTELHSREFGDWQISLCQCLALNAT
jgi:hypothetical protein